MHCRLVSGFRVGSQLPNAFPKFLAVPPVRRPRISNLSGDSGHVEVDDDGLPKDYKLKTLKTASRRLDTIISRAIGTNTSQVEKLILSGKVHLNEDAVKKKAYNVQNGDVVDVWNGPVEENPALAVVQRIEVCEYDLKNHGYEIKIKYWKSMFVENWRGN